MKKRLLQLVFMFSVPLAMTAQVVVFSDNFSNGSTINESNPPAPTLLSSSYEEIASKKWDPNPPTLTAGDLQFGIAATSGGGTEVQALFTTTPVVLQNPGDSIQLTVIFTETQGLLSSDTQWGIGLFDAGQVAPWGGGIYNAANKNNDDAATGGAQNWQGCIAQIAYAGGSMDSQFTVRPQQDNANNRNQVTEVHDSNTYGFANATDINDSSDPNVALTDGNQYAEVLTYTLLDDGSVGMVASLYANGVGGAPLTTIAATNDSPLSLNFDGLSMGFRSKNEDSSTIVDVTSVQVVTTAAYSGGSSCITETESPAYLFVGQPSGKVTITIPVDATASGPVSVDLVSSDPSVAYAGGAAGGTVTVTFPENSPYMTTNVDITTLESGSTMFYLTNATAGACIEEELSSNLVTVSCVPITLSPGGSIASLVGQTDQTFTVGVPSYAAANGPVSMDLVSSDPSVAYAGGVAGGTVTVTFPQGSSQTTTNLAITAIGSGSTLFYLTNIIADTCIQDGLSSSLVTVSCDPITLSPVGSIVSLIGQTNQTLTVSIPPYANANGPVTVDLTSLNPSVVTFQGAVNGTLPLTFPSGGATNLTISLDVLSVGTSTLVLTNNAGPICTLIPDDSTLVVTVPLTNGISSQTETFDTQTQAASDGWMDFEDQANGQSYGWSDSANAGGTSGEAGGSFVRYTNRSYYADVTVGPLTLNDSISASGVLIIAPPSQNATFNVGYFNTNNPNGDQNILGIGLADGNYPEQRISSVIGLADGTYHEDFGPAQLVGGLAVPWDFNYDPTGGASGNGELTLNYTANGSPYTEVRDLSAEDREKGGSFNAFGLLVRGVSGLDTTDVMGIYMDNVTYTKGHSLAPSPVPLQIQATGGSLTFTWTDPSFSLGFSTNVVGPYVKIPGAVSGFTTNTTDQTGFFRLIWP